MQHLVPWKRMLMNNSRAQVSAEFLVMLTVVFIAFGFAVNAYSEKSQGYELFRQSFEAKNIAQQLGGAINSVYLASDGASAKVFLVSRYDFDLNTANNAIQVIYGDNYYDAPLLPESAKINSFSLSGFNTVKNAGGVVEVYAG